jgi:hypothetical protein
MNYLLIMSPPPGPTPLFLKTELKNTNKNILQKCAFGVFRVTLLLLLTFTRRSSTVTPPRVGSETTARSAGAVVSACTVGSETAGRAFVARLWTELDLQACKHCAAKCGCHECGHSSICEHGRQRNICKECHHIFLWDRRSEMETTSLDCMPFATTLAGDT